MSCQHKWVLVPKHKLREAKYLCTECDADMSIEQYESVKQAHRAGWEQAKREAQQALCEICCYNSADNPVPDECTTCNESRAIASMEYTGTEND